MERIRFSLRKCKSRFSNDNCPAIAEISTIRFSITLVIVKLGIIRILLQNNKGQWGNPLSVNYYSTFGFSPFSTQFLPIVTLVAFSDGKSYIVSSSKFSTIERNPLAPVLREIAF